MPLTCDLAIVGAGAAGSAAAARAVELGLDTVLVARRGAGAAGARVLEGAGRLAGPGRLHVDLAAGGAEAVAAERIVLAAGLRPAAAASLKTDGERILDWRQFTGRAPAADAVLVVGAGTVGMALASRLATAGGAVRLIEMRERVLGDTDGDLAAAAAARLRNQGVDLLTATRVIAAVSTDEGVAVRLLDIAGGKERAVVVPLVVIAAGRRPDSRDLGLATVAVETDRHGHVLTDSHQETATPGLYAIGGLVATLRTPTAAYREAHQAVDHAAGRPQPPVRYGQLARRCELTPELAWVGLSESDAVAGGRVARAAAIAAPDPARGYVKLVADAESSQLLGAHLLGDGAAALAAEIGRTLGRVTPGDLGTDASPLGALLRRAAVALRESAP